VHWIFFDVHIFYIVIYSFFTLFFRTIYVLEKKKIYICYKILEGVNNIGV